MEWEILQLLSWVSWEEICHALGVEPEALCLLLTNSGRMSLSRKTWDGCCGALRKHVRKCYENQ